MKSAPPVDPVPRPDVVLWRMAEGVVQLVLHFRVLWLVILTGWVDTTLSQGHALERLGYGVPALTDGRIWTLLTGMFLNRSLTVPMPWFSVVAIVLYEHVARHWRTAVVFAGGQVAGVLIVCLTLWPIEVVRESTDVGMSVGGFALLAAWTAHLSAKWRRRLRIGLSPYFVPLLLLHPVVYDYTHPGGWLLGIWMGERLLPDDARRDDQPFAGSELPGIVLTAAIATALGYLIGR